MDRQYFRSRWTAPSSHPLYYSPGARLRPAVPAVRNQTEAVYPPTHTVSRTPKVVTIPVRFVEPERDRLGSALKIQKALRGFMVRKSVRRIAALSREVDEIERRVSDPEAVKLMRGDSRERLRVSEMLMSVLFRLDSVRGVDSGVRDYRKAVTRRTIALQELIDAIAAKVEPTQSYTEADSGAEGCEHRPELHHASDQEDDEVKLKSGDEIAAENGAEEDGLVPTMRECSGESTNNDKSESQTDSTSSRRQSLVEGAGENVMGRDRSGEEEEKEADEVDSDSKGTGNKELMEKTVEDNQRMMGLVEELFERNKRQTQLLSSLSQRVERLERVLVCEMLRRKRKKKCQDVSAPPETRKCMGRER
ncbi:hypothetical protein SAY86_003045 [Trapa natans]|uniref:BAG domain-containing protein n=1 Tax=Trapa natans TaxID=22666 RepID=A0AAN7LHA0_TRANT|nr:hypothetical protein SAY86_003045 [Trapa natans]